MGGNGWVEGGVRGRDKYLYLTMLSDFSYFITFISVLKEFSMYGSDSLAISIHLIATISPVVLWLPLYT